MNNPGTLEDQKRQLRREVRAWLAGLPDGERARRSREICARIQRRLCKLPVARLALFVAMPAEPDLSRLWAMGWEIVLPKVSGPRLSLWLVPDAASVAPGYRGIREPDERLCEPIAVDSVDLILVPGLAFSASDGMRLGRGGGFYDRLLGESGKARWGVCFEEQVREVIPGGDHDAKVDVLITCRREVEIGGRENGMRKRADEA